MVICVYREREMHLAEVGNATDALGPLLRARQRRQDHARENGDDRHHDKQLDQGEPSGLVPGTICVSLRPRMTGSSGFPLLADC